MIDLTEDERDYYEERAGIMEYDAGLPRETAEARALKETLKRRRPPIEETH